MSSTLIPLSEVARRTGRAQEVLRRWAVAGRIPATKLGRDWYVRESDIPTIDAMPRRDRDKAGD